jgi:hypothetical protein
MGKLLSEWLNRAFFFGLVVRSPRDVTYARIQEPHVTWDEIEEYLSREKGTA